MSVFQIGNERLGRIVHSSEDRHKITLGVCVDRFAHYMHLMLSLLTNSYFVNCPVYLRR